MEPTPEDWLRREALLDQLLDLPEPERAAFIAKVAADNADDAAALGRWLAGIERSADYLLPKAALQPGGHEGAVIGNWRALHVLGRGGMGEVWLGERADGLFARKVAIKFIRADRPGLARAIESERRVLASLQHPGIVRLLDAGTLDDGQPWLVTEHIEGRSLDAWLQQEQPGIDVRLDLFRRIADAVAYAHGQLVIHRDIKPGNILVDGAGVPHLLDFGIARVLAPDHTDAGATQVALTPEFAAPELIIDNAASVRSDVYALGGVLFFLLCGRAPLELGGLALGAMVERIRDVAPLPPAAHALPVVAASASRPLLEDLGAIALKALAKPPGERYGSVDGLLADIDAARERRPISARAPHWLDRSRRYLHRHRVGVAVASVLVLSLLAGMAGTLWQAREARAQQQRAEAEARRATTQAQTANAVRDFLIGVFDAANPEASGGQAPNAVELVDAGVRQAETTLAGQPEMQARLFDALSRTYQGLGEYDKAIALSRKGHEAAVSALGEGSALAADLAISHARAVGHADAGNDQARALLEKIVAHPPSAQQGAVALYQLATLDRREGRLDEAEARFQQAVKQLRGLGVPAEGELAEALHQLAGLDESRGRRNQAIAHLRQAIALHEHDGGRPSADANLLRVELANLLSNAGQTDEALLALRQVLGDNRALYGPEHPRTLSSAAWLGRALVRKAAYSDADQLLQQTLQVARTRYGEQSEVVAEAAIALAASKFAQGQMPEAIEMADIARRYAVAHGGQDSYRAIITTQNTARFHLANGDYANAEAIAHTVLASLQRIGSDNGNDALELIGSARRHRGDAQGALAAHQQALEILRRNGDETSLDVQMLRTELAEDLRDLGRLDEARRLALQAREGLHALGAQSNVEMGVYTRYLLAQFDVLEGRCTAADDIRAMVATSEAKPALSPLAQWRTAYARVLLGMCLQQQGGDDAAARALMVANARALQATAIASPQARRVAARALRGNDARG